MKTNESSQPDGQHHESDEIIVKPFLLGKTLSEESRERLHLLAQRPDSEINTEDIPEIEPGPWKDAILNPYISPVRLRKAS